ncbi:MAG: hypothetical protein KAX38_05040, partial [Candidatus Krumholzibacteria bacterium]|nr:hypothetical protein [Candidatus Krumholzibacteria bacterium]
VRIVVSNEGNDREEYKVTQSVPTGFITFLPPPESCEDEACEWTLHLDPYETLEVIYRIEYWPIFLEGLVVAVLFVSFVAFTWSRINFPKLSKELRRSGKGYTAVIEIRNAGNRITNVVVRDVVSPLFDIKEDFETLQPVVKRGEDGTELVWSLGVLNPKEHRILHYKIRPLVGGKLRLPKAYMRFLTRTKKSKAYSNDLTVAV